MGVKCWLLESGRRGGGTENLTEQVRLSDRAEGQSFGLSGLTRMDSAVTFISLG